MLHYRLKRLSTWSWIILLLLFCVGAVMMLFPYRETFCQTCHVSAEMSRTQIQDQSNDLQSRNLLPVHYRTTPYHSHRTSLNNKIHFNAVINQSCFQNISRLANYKIFHVFTDDLIPGSNWSSYKLNTLAENDLNFPYLITGEICKKDIPYVLIIIPSVINAIERRDHIRNTWLRAAETNSWPREKILDKVKHIFFFGLRKDDRLNGLDLLMRESLLNNDIVVADFEDSYRNLSIKMLVSLKWTIKYCDQVQFVLKSDMDTFINVPLMLSLLHFVQSNVTSDKFIIGFKQSYDKPIVVRDTGRWKVAHTEYPLAYYPKHVYGHAYALSIGNINALVTAAENKPIIAPEDAFITGILPKLTGALRLDAPSFSVCCRMIFDCEIVWNNNVAITEIKNAERLKRLWDNIVNRQCNDTWSIDGTFNKNVG